MNNPGLRFAGFLFLVLSVFLYAETQAHKKIENLPGEAAGFFNDCVSVHCHREILDNGTVHEWCEKDRLENCCTDAGIACNGYCNNNPDGYLECKNACKNAESACERGSEVEASLMGSKQEY